MKLAMGNVFRVFFEICLTAAAAFGGSMLSKNSVGAEEWLIFAIVSILAIASLVVSFIPGKIATFMYPSRDFDADVNDED